MPSPIPTYSGLCIGVLTLLPVDEVFTQFAPYGFTKSGFISFLNALGCPHLTMPDGTKMIDIVSFQVAIKALSRYGGDGFDATKMPRGASFAKEPEKHFEHWKAVLGELRYGADFSVQKLPSNARSVFTTARDRIAMGLSQRTGMSVSNFRSNVSRSVDRYNPDD